MGIELDHIIVPATDKRRSAAFLAGILGLEPSPEWGPFVPLEVANDVTLDFIDSRDFRQQHCAFRIDDAAFDGVLGRIRESGTGWYADPGRQQPHAINRRFGGRGVYFDDPDGHLMEVLTRPDSPKDR